MNTQVTGSLVIYMAYLLRYTPKFPTTAGELSKMAAAKHFRRLAEYLASQPADRLYQSAEEVMAELKQAGADDTQS